jgi:hypothetical protein
MTPENDKRFARAARTARTLFEIAFFSFLVWRLAESGAISRWLRLAADALDRLRP